MRFTHISTLLLGLSITMTSMAADLLTIYQQAQTFDPTLSKAAAERLSAREGLPQSQAALLPSLSAQASINQYSSHNSMPVSATNPVKSSTYGVTAYSLSITQPLFNFASWMTLRQADAQVKQADAVYGVALQDLIYRTAKTYFTVLQMEDALRITQAQKNLLARQLDEAKQRFAVGMNTITEVYNAQASYDKTTAQEIMDKNAVNNSYEALRTITGQRYDALAVLYKQIPLLTPKPVDVEQWVNAAEQQNLMLKAARFAMDAAREAIKVKAAGHLPSLEASGSYTYTNGGTMSTPLAANLEGTSLGLTLKVPLYQGGAINAQTRQAQYNFQAAAAGMQIIHQKVLAETRQYYASVLADISRLTADRLLVKSARSAYESNLAAYQVGTKTNVDVLAAQKDLFDAQRQYSADQYTYIIDTLLLKQLAGTLHDTDLQMINAWLKTKDEKQAKQAVAEAIGAKIMQPMAKA